MLSVFMMTAFAALIILFVYCCYMSCNKGTYQGKLLGRTFMGICIVFLAFAMNYLSNSEHIMGIMCAVEHASMDFALYFFMLFIFSFVGVKEVKPLKYLTLGIVSLDALILLTNPINHLAFSPLARTSERATVIVPSGSVLFYTHLGLCAFFVIMIGFCLVKKTFEVSPYYHLRYAYMLILLIAFVASNYAFNAYTELLFDYSKLLYAFSVIIIYYLTYGFSPRKLLKRLNEYVLDTVTDPMVIYDSQGNLFDVNSRAKALFEDRQYNTIENFLTFLRTEEEGTFKKEIDGRIYEIRYEKFYDKKSIYIAAGFFMHDVTENEQQLEREHRAAILDPLTNCYNRVGFFEYSRKFLEDNMATGSFSILVCGICNFKGLNGLYGTKTGDEILCTIAEKLYGFHCKYPMIYGRSAEGKFSCLLPCSCVPMVISMLNRITINLGGDSQLCVDLCFGYVNLDQQNVKFEEYYEMAQMALSNCWKKPHAVVEYTQDMADDALRLQLLLAETHDEVDGKQFYIELQPQIDLKRNKVCGAEALVRWEHPTLGKIGPNQFIPVFENNGFITQLDHFVWEQAAATIAKLSDAGLYDGHISVNVSQVDIKNTDVASDMEKIIRKYGIPAEKLHVEITESACADDRDTLIATMNRLRKKGFLVEIDDFGSGYSSLNALIKLPFDIVKLDMLFMKEYVEGDKSDVVISSVSKMIHDLNATLVIEGIETAMNLEIAKDIDADVAQGYYFSKPVSVQQFVEFVSANQ